MIVHSIAVDSRFEGSEIGNASSRFQFVPPICENSSADPNGANGVKIRRVWAIFLGCGPIFSSISGNCRRVDRAEPCVYVGCVVGEATKIVDLLRYSLS